MSVGQGSKDFEGLCACVRGDVAEETGADQFEEIVGEVREIAEGLVFDLAVLSEGAAEEVGLIDLSFVFSSGRGYVHSAMSSFHVGIIHYELCKSSEKIHISGYIMHRTLTA